MINEPVYSGVFLHALTYIVPNNLIFVCRLKTFHTHSKRERKWPKWEGGKKQLDKKSVKTSKS